MIDTLDRLGLAQTTQDQLLEKIIQHTESGKTTNEIYRLSIEDIKQALIEQGSSTAEVAK
nr:MAG TPA: hypothetical protein [Bacteriophage sp.]